MSSILQSIIETQAVEIDGERVPVSSNVDFDEGRFLQALIRRYRPIRSLEIGFAYGISSLFICEALKEVNEEFRHTIIDPHQTKNWHGIGLQNLRTAGYLQNCTLVEDYSEFALPKLLKSGARFDFTFIDGWHTFDHTLADFFFINKMLDLGGIVAFDDTNYPSIRRVIAHVLTYPAYRLEGFWPNPKAKRHQGLRAFKRFLKGKRPLGPDPQASARCIAVRKISEDQRSFDWHEDF